MIAKIIDGQSRRRASSQRSKGMGGGPPDSPYAKHQHSPAISLRSRFSSAVAPPADLLNKMFARKSTRVGINAGSEHGTAEGHPSPSKDDGVKGTILSRQYIGVLAGSMVCYGLLHLIIRHSGSDMCNVDRPLSPWVHQVGIAVVACYALATVYFLTCVSTMYSWSASKDREETHVKAVFCASATISVIAGCATAIFLTNEGRFVCRGRVLVVGWFVGVGCWWVVCLKVWVVDG